MMNEYKMYFSFLFRVGQASGTLVLRHEGVWTTCPKIFWFDEFGVQRPKNKIKRGAEDRNNLRGDGDLLTPILNISFYFAVCEYDSKLIWFWKPTTILLVD